MSGRKQKVKLFLTESLKNSDVYVNGDKVQTNSKEIASRLNEALGKLVSNVYHKLSYIDSAMNESDIRELFRNSRQITIDGTYTPENKLALDDVNNYIALNTSRHMKTSMKSLTERFLKPPYGFVEADIWWIVAKLFKDGEISMFVNNEAVTLLSKTPEEIIRYITRREFNEKLMIEKRVKANEKQKKSVREVMKELFNTAASGDDDDIIMEDFIDNAKKLEADLKMLEERCYNSESAYPGRMIIRDGKKLILDVLQMKYTNEFFNEIDRKKDDYLDFAEDYEPLKKFFSGGQKEIFDKALKWMKIYDDSKTFIVDSDIENVVSDIKSILIKAAPYSEIFKLPELLQKFIQLYDEICVKTEEPVMTAINEARTRVFDELKGKQCSDRLSDKFIRLFKEITDKAESCNNIAVLQNIRIEADALKVRCLNEINAEEAKFAVIAPVNDDTDNGEVAPVTKPVKKQKTISIKSVNHSATWQIETAEDVKKYISELENRLMQALESDTIINIEF